MPQIEDLSGQRFGRYTVMCRAESYVSKSGSSQSRWLCRCDCGNERIVFAQSLKSGKSRSCGCLQRDVAKTHGWKNTRLYGIWHNMKWRCNNENAASYHNYGGRGISVCKAWEQFEPFMEWALKNGYSDELSIDRIDNNGNYCPDNCRWVNAKEQANNRRTNNLITANGETLTISEWEKKSGLSRQLILWRLRHGWSPNDATSKPRRGQFGRC